ncbi:putative retrotransposon protein [Tanacetum coccineum]
MGYSFYYPAENKIFVARNAKFFENDVIDHEASGSLKDLKIIQEDTHLSLDTSLDHEEDDKEINEPQSDLNPICRSTRTRHPTDRLCLYVDVEEHELGDLGEPANYKAALLDPESDKWLNAMNVEMQSMKDNKFGNVKTAFFPQWILNKRYSWKQPKGLSHRNFLNRVCKLKTLPFMDLSKHLASGSYVTFLILYVDDILIMGNNIPMLQDVKSYLGRCFAMKDLGEAAYILGIKIYRDRSKRLIGLCQSAYIEKILKRFYMENSKRGTISMQEKPEIKQIASFWILATLDAGYLTDAEEILSNSERSWSHKVQDIFRAKVHYLRETIEMGDVRIEKVDTDDNLADPFTKALAFPKHSELTEKIGMIPASSLM